MAKPNQKRDSWRSALGELRRAQLRKRGSTAIAWTRIEWRAASSAIILCARKTDEKYISYASAQSVAALAGCSVGVARRVLVDLDMSGVLYQFSTLSSGQRAYKAWITRPRRKRKGM